MLESDALLAGRTRYRDSDLICTLLCRRAGKVSVIARSARNSRKRFGAALDFFVLGRAMIRPTASGSLARLERFEGVEDLSAQLTPCASRMAAASYLLEVSREMWPEGQREPQLFELILEGLRSLAADVAHPAQLLASFELHLMREVGLMPTLNHCVCCGRAIAGNETADFSLTEGGVRCDQCSHGRSSALAVGLRRSFARILSSSLVAGAQTLEGLACRRQVLDCARKLIRSQLPRRLASASVLEQVEIDASLRPFEGFCSRTERRPLAKVTD